MTTSDVAPRRSTSRPPLLARAPVAHGRDRSAAISLVRFLLIFPTIFILVTLVFFFVRATGDPITAALGGRLPADQLAERIHEAGYRPADHRAVPRVSRPDLHRQLRHDLHRQPAGRRRHPPLRRRDARARLLRAAHRLRHRHPARHARRRAARSLARTPACASPRSSGTRRRCSSPASCSSSSSRSGSAGSRSSGRASVRTETRARRDGGGTGIYIIDALASGNPAYVGDVLAARGPSRHHAGSADGRHLPATGAHQRHRHALDALRRRGPLARRERVPPGAQARLQAGAHPDHHGHRPADRPAARRRGADRDHLRVGGSRLPAHQVPRRP